MTSPHQIERQRGIKEAGQQLGALRERWPLAFLVQHQDIRPLALGVAHQVAAGMGWSLPYTLSVLRRWKMAAVYRQAVLSHDQRIALDGTSAELVDPNAKELAAAQLAARNAVKPAVPTTAKPKPASPSHMAKKNASASTARGRAIKVASSKPTG
jgi:sRNA-binding protein